MAVNKVVYGNQILIDITDSTVNPNTLLAGYKAYGANGEQVTGNVTLSYHITLHKAQYEQLTPAEQMAEENFFYIDDAEIISAEIDDTTTSSSKVWSSLRTYNCNKTTTLTVDTTNWTQDTTSQSGTTLYKKQISLNHIYVDCPNVDIGASGVLPTTAQQEAYNLIQYVTVDSAVPCLYLYASAIPSTSFYINVVGVD